MVDKSVDNGVVHWSPERELYKPYLRSWVKRGCGIGQGASYRPMFNVREIPSRGTCHVIQGIKVSRQYHLLSDLEATHFLIRERNPKVIDIRENFPIYHIDWTMEACSRLGIRHPYKNGLPFPFTLDFVVTELVEDGVTEIAESIKSPESAANPKTRRQLSIEANWCRIRAQIPYFLIDTTAYISKLLLSTLMFMRAWAKHGYTRDTQREIRFERAFSKAYERNVPLGMLIDRVAKNMRIQDELALDMFRFCTWHDQLPVSLKHQLAVNRPVILR
jgi:hypothetical protein